METPLPAPSTVTLSACGCDRVGLASRWQKRENKSASLSGNEWNGVTDCSSAVEEGGTGHGLWALARTTWWTEGLFPGMRGPADRQAGRMVPPLAVEAVRAKQTMLPRGSPRRGGKCQARGSAGSGEAIAKMGDCSTRSSDEGHGPNERRKMVTKAGERWLGSASAKQMQEGCFLGGGSWPVLPVVCLATL